MRKHTTIATMAAVVLTCVTGASATVVTDTVPVGNPGNAGEWSGEGYGGFGPDRICGAVDHTYSIAKYEVTAGQYTAFLNAVAGVDTYALYNNSMWSENYGCKIERFDGSGTGGDPYQYRVAGDFADRPVNFVSWGDSARFANWLHNGQPTGPQDSNTTEDGSYFLDGALTNTELLAIARQTDATWVIPTEDEWYKAAYHKNDGPSANYFNYPTSSDSVPSYIGDGAAITNPDPGNYATYDGDGGIDGIGHPYYRTQVGEHENSASPYGTFDQGGNVWEWNEATPHGSYRGLRGGSFFSFANNLHAADRLSGDPAYENYMIGFRVAVPEPASITLLALGGLLVVKRRR